MATSISDLLLQTPIGSKELQCGKHGAYQSSGIKFTTGRGREIWTSCPECKTEADEAAKREILTAKADAQTARIQEMIQRTAIPARFIGRSFDNYQASTPEQLKALAICRHFVETFDERAAKKGYSLIFSGEPGTGKSHLAAAILQALLPRHVGAYMTFSEMIRLIRDTWGAAATKSETQVIAELAGLPLLVIDEIGVQRGSVDEHNLFFEIMDRRYRDQRPSILMTNQDAAGFKLYAGDRVYDRMTEIAKWVSFEWPSFRRQAKKEFE